MSAVRRSLLVTFVASNVKTVGLFVLTLALARLLTPEDIGAFSIGVVIINVVAVVRDFGTGAFLVQKPQIEGADVRAVLGLTLTFSWLLACALLLVAPSIASGFGDLRIEAVIGALTLSFLLVPYVNTLASLLMRHLSAERSAVVGLGSAVLYAAACLTFALLDFGALALAWGNFVHLLANLLGYLALRPRQYPLRPAWRGWQPALRFGVGLLPGQLSQVAYQSAPDLVLGKVSGTYDLGLFSRANGLVGIFQQAIGPAMNFTALPYFSQQRDTGVPVSDTFLRSVSLLTTLAWPFLAWVAIFASPLIATLYGTTWAPAAPLVPWLCLAAASRCVNDVLQPALLSMGRSGLASRALIAGLLCRLSCVAIFGTGGLTAFVVALCAGDVLACAAQSMLACRTLELPARQLLRTLSTSLALTSVGTLAFAAVHWLAPERSAPWLGAAAGAACMLALLWVTGHSAWEAIKSAACRLPGARKRSG